MKNIKIGEKKSTFGFSFIPFYFLFKKELARFYKVLGQTILTPVVNSTLYLLIFGVSLGTAIRLEEGIPYLHFLAPGLMMMTGLNNAYQNSSSSIVSSKFYGDLSDLKTLPLKSLDIVFAFALAGLCRGVIVGALTLLVAEVFSVFSTGQWIPMQHPFLMFFFLSMGCFMFSCIGLSVGLRASNFERVNAIGSFVLLPLLYLGGVFYRLDQLHPFWKMATRFNPLYYLVSGNRFAFLGIEDIPILSCFFVSCFFFFFFLFIAHLSVTKGKFTRWS